MKLENGLIVTGSILLPTVENTGSVGNIWFDGTNVKYSTNVGAWSAGGTMITARWSAAGAGTTDAFVTIGGYSGVYTGATEEYNGSSWASSNNLITGRYIQGGGTGTQNSALAASGQNPSIAAGLTCTEEYNGSTWSNGGSLASAGYNIGLTGTQDAALRSGQRCSIYSYSCTEEYNGSSWSSGGAMIRNTQGHTAFGTQNATLIALGTCSSPAADYCYAATYDGTSWSAISSLSAGAVYRGGGAGTVNSGFVAVSSNTSQCWDGTTWSSNVCLITSRSAMAYNGTSISALFAGGNAPGASSVTEEYNQSITACTL